MNDSLKNWSAYLGAALVVAAGVYGFYHFSESLLVLRLAIVIVSLVLAAGIMYLSTPGRVFAQFAREAIEEGKKVAWPDRQDTMRMTLIVFAFAVVMALFLFMVDWLIALIIAWLTARG